MPLTWSMRTVHLSSFSTCSLLLDQAAMYLHNNVPRCPSPHNHQHHTPRSLPASLHLNVLDPIPPSVSRGSVPSTSSCNTHSPWPHPRHSPHRGRALSSALFPSYSGP
ncbi:hypothetical protein COCMIDRAFT_38889 [Bipolaris oryzae ATCC 44560]|uniref:Uncharacterized protein n=1 Tax=Bipolaris oryzae ATCC 44560 TaxID=930090 RepID=W6Z001_COCMI|nr:uncharacterized protein COCMIDRAFT_38889 [Bipolaris oryzae ATCC 44560]EUC43160.1 hypothetical protein COCMIDRAFT_38889 [Bipolaris oryzae ATCC 44560]